MTLRTPVPHVLSLQGARGKHVSEKHVEARTPFTHPLMAERRAAAPHIHMAVRGSPCQPLGRAEDRNLSTEDRGSQDRQASLLHPGRSAQPGPWGPTLPSALHGLHRELGTEALWAPKPLDCPRLFPDGCVYHFTEVHF